MNKVTWVIQTNLLKDSSVQGVWLAAEEYGADVREAIIIPFQDELDNEDVLNAMNVEPDRVVIPYGSCKLTRISQERKWRGNCFNKDTFMTHVWNSNRDDMLNSDAVQMRVKDTPEFFADKILADKWFIRPVADLKAFNGTVTEAEEIVKWMHSTASGNFSFNEDTEIIIAPVKKLYSEARFFVIGGKVVDGSYYKMADRAHLHNIKQPETLATAQTLADKWLPHECCVMDVADTDDGLKVIEFNTINSSGFYDNNIKVIVQSMTDWARNL
ncbi:protein of unknown function DUF 4343 [Xanthomonas phage Xoo-sp13]|nr:protein of unknown function DUF 4343 [Xanthomonas phage Xoo-sp13]